MLPLYKIGIDNVLFTQKYLIGNVTQPPIRYIPRDCMFVKGGIFFFRKRTGRLFGLGIYGIYYNEVSVI